MSHPRQRLTECFNKRAIRAPQAGELAGESIAQLRIEVAAFLRLVDFIEAFLRRRALPGAVWLRLVIKLDEVFSKGLAAEAAGAVGIATFRQ
jgi:hypothetical protein